MHGQRSGCYDHNAVRLVFPGPRIRTIETPMVWQMTAVQNTCRNEFKSHAYMRERSD